MRVQTNKQTNKQTLIKSLGLIHSNSINFGNTTLSWPFTATFLNGYFMLTHLEINVSHSQELYIAKLARNRMYVSFGNKIKPLRKCHFIPYQANTKISISWNFHVDDIAVRSKTGPWWFLVWRMNLTEGRWNKPKNDQFDQHYMHKKTVILAVKVAFDFC